MTDPLKEASTSGWIAKHREQYIKDPEAGHMWDSTAAGGPGPVPTLLLTTTGRKSGKTSIMPLIYGPFANGYTVIASKGGDPRHPGWYHNLQAQDTVTVQLVHDIFPARHRTLDGSEREQAWQFMAEIYPPYIDYQRKTDREIPVILLERTS